MLRRLIQRATGLHVYRRPPRGADIFADIANDLPRLRVQTIFDVGANLGQSAAEYLRAYPHADIHCFEPVADTAAKLAARFGNRVRVHRIALSSSDGEGKMSLEGSSDTFRLVGATSADDSGETEAVPVQTLDSFCRAQAIDHISYLKIDTEGADLEVLRGASGMLKAGRIDLVQVEAGMNPGHDWHVPFETLKAQLESFGYHLFSVFEQTRNWYPGAPYMQWANPVFVSNKVVDDHRDYFAAGASSVTR
jgi:FkbM family methyltransferase